MHDCKGRGGMQDPLGIEREKSRRLGYEVVDMLVDGMSDLGRPLQVNHASPSEMGARLPLGLPEEGTSLTDVIDELKRVVLPHYIRADHPSYFAFVPGSSTWPGALADFIAGALNVHATSWHECPGPSHIELVVLDWFKKWIGYPPESGGVLVSGGSAANMTALACAREALLGPMSDKAIVYVSDQTHSSIARAARVLGFRPEQVRVLPANEEHQMPVEALASLMSADVSTGLRPLFVAAAGGSTNTGAIDPLPDIISLCRERGVWSHVDGAYGGFAALSERGKRDLKGMEDADSLTLDPHKWLYQPYECGCLLVREGRHLRGAFEIIPDYLRDTEAGADEVNFSDLGLQLTRSWRALKVWMSIKYFGAEAFRRAIDNCLDLALMAQHRIEASRELELMSPARLGIVTFRRRFDDAGEATVEQRNAALVPELARSGTGMISSTRLHGRFALRMCVLNHSSTLRDVERVLSWIEQASTPQDRADGTSARGFERQPPILSTPVIAASVKLSSLRRLSLFTPLDDQEMAWLTTVVRKRTAQRGEFIVRRWEYTRDFYVILEGTAEVLREEEHVDELGPGQFFGELAAMDWGAGFGYPRLASVVATAPLQLVEVPGSVLNTLMRRHPPISDLIRQAVRERLPHL